jgi:hypothetical protein
VQVRGRAIGGAALAVALVVAVVSLRGQVEPPGSGPTAQPMPTTTPSLRALPVRPAERATQWRTFELPAGTLTAMADPEHIVIAGITNPAGPPPRATLTVRSRDGSAREHGYQPQPAGWEPVNWQILDGALYVTEVPVEGNGLGSTRLMRVDLSGGSVEQIPVRSVQPLWPSPVAAGDSVINIGRPSLLTVGDELIGTGISAKNPSEQCAIAIRPSTGAERTVACGIGTPILEPADGEALIRLGDNTPNGCSMRLITPGRGELMLPIHVECQQRQIIPIDDWQAYLIDGPGPAQPLLATNGTDRVMLGTAKMAAVSCHGRLYWVSGDSSEWSLGREVLRWTPGDSEVEVVRRSRGQTEFGWPTCVDGTLGVLAHPSAVGSRLSRLMVLDRP